MKKPDDSTRASGGGKTGAYLYGLFSSVKTTVTLCLLMAVISLAGTLIKQNASPQEYAHLYGSVLTGLFRKLGLFDLYHSRGFTLLLLLLAANLLCCSIRNLPRIWRLSFGPRAVPTPKALKARRNSATLASSHEAPEALRRATLALERSFGTAENLPGEAGSALHCRKGAFSRFGPYLAHIGILLILAGAVIGSLFGFRGYMNIPEGEAASSVRLFGSMEELPLGFSVRCKSFLVDFYENGMPREYRSELEVHEGDEAVLTGAVRVNHPLTYRGIHFYQSSYGQAGPARVALEVRDKASEARTEVSLRMGEDWQMPETGDRIRLLNYTPDFTMPGRAPGMPTQGLGPAVQLMVFRDGQHTRPYWVLRDYPDVQNTQDRPYTVTLKQVVPRYYTGLQVGKDPGTPVVWAGCTLLILGLIVAFYFSQRDVWVLVTPEKKGSAVVVAGWATKNPESFQKVFEGVASEIEASLSAAP